MWRGLKIILIGTVLEKNLERDGLCQVYFVKGMLHMNEYLSRYVEAQWLYGHSLGTDGDKEMGNDLKLVGEGSKGDVHILSY